MKMCPSTDQELFLLSRGELPLLKELAVRAHLLTCPGCRARVNDFNQVSAMLQKGYTGFPPLPPLWRRMPVFPIGTLIVAGLISTAFVVYHSHAKPSLIQIHRNSNQDGDSCALGPIPAPPKRDPKSFLTWGQKSGATKVIHSQDPGHRGM